VETSGKPRMQDPRLEQVTFQDWNNPRLEQAWAEVRVAYYKSQVAQFGLPAQDSPDRKREQEEHTWLVERRAELVKEYKDEENSAI